MPTFSGTLLENIFLYFNLNIHTHTHKNADTCELEVAKSMLMSTLEQKHAVHIGNTTHTMQTGCCHCFLSPSKCVTAHTRPGWSDPFVALLAVASPLLSLQL